jgi:predicted RNA-binding Zn ribbon-like protein
VTHAAVELLADGRLERLKVCANCRWLFLDQSRNRSRRWCSMADCGTAVKMERFVERRRVRRESAG